MRRFESCSWYFFTFFCKWPLVSVALMKHNKTYIIYLLKLANAWHVMVNLHLCLVVNRLSKVNLFLVTLVIYLGFATLLHNYFISNRIKAAEDNHHYHDLHVQPQHQKFKPNLRKFNITNLNGGDTINNKDVPNQTKKSNEAKMRKKTKSKSSHVHHQQEEAQQSYKSIRDEWYEVIKTCLLYTSPSPRD